MKSIKRIKRAARKAKQNRIERAEKRNAKKKPHTKSAHELDIELRIARTKQIGNKLVPTPAIYAQEHLRELKRARRK